MKEINRLKNLGIRQKSAFFYGMAAWKWNGDLMARKKTDEIRYYEAGLIRILIEENKPKNILNIGSGSNNLEKRLPRELTKKIKIFDIDLSSASLAFARQITPQANFVKGDAFNLPFRSKSIDMVLSQHVLSLFVDDDLPQIFKEINDVLTPGGIFTYCEFIPLEKNSKAAFQEKNPKYPPLHPRFKMEEELNHERSTDFYEGLLNNAGFEIIGSKQVTWNTEQVVARKMSVFDIYPR